MNCDLIIFTPQLQYFWYSWDTLRMLILSLLFSMNIDGLELMVFIGVNAAIR